MTNQITDQIQDFYKEAQSRILSVSSEKELQDLRVEFLGKKGGLTQILKSLGTLSPDERKEVGQHANEIKAQLTALLVEKQKLLQKAEIERQLANETVDVSLDGVPMPKGSLHPVTLVLEECKRIFRHMGFDIAEGPEIETDFYNFEALNIPKNHPARDMQDTFYLPDGRVLRTHTSPVQIHVMENSKPPIAMVAPGVVYRCDSDVTHTPMFHQLEALLVDEHIHMGHMKAVIHEFLKHLFGEDLKLRFRSSFFPFTEPSAEVDMSCVFCKGEGCRVCSHTGWLEIMGCGMVNPKVYEFVNIDPKKYSGFAFGMGIERVGMLKYGINDLRLFFENDIRFLRQFV